MKSRWRRSITRVEIKWFRLKLGSLTRKLLLLFCLNLAAQFFAIFFLFSLGPVLFCVTVTCTKCIMCTFRVVHLTSQKKSFDWFDWFSCEASVFQSSGTKKVKERIKRVTKDLILISLKIFNFKRTFYLFTKKHINRRKLNTYYTSMWADFSIWIFFDYLTFCLTLKNIAIKNRY